MGFKARRRDELSEAQCWALIEENVHFPPDGKRVHTCTLPEALARLTPAQVLDFDRVVSKAFLDSYTWPMWGAAYLIHWGCPDDTFDYFRSWLIARGRADFTAAMANPDNLADFANEGALDDEVYGAGQEAYEAMTGNELESMAKRPALDKSFDFSNQEDMRRRYPKLYARFGARIYEGK